MYVCVYVGFGSSGPDSGPYCLSPVRQPHVDAIAPPSPNWHRAARRRRAKARKRVWKARRQGAAPPARDLRELAEHHSRPGYRELQEPMGKAGKWGAGWKSQTSYHGHEAWPEYYGSHSDYYGRPHKWTAEPSGSAFPTFEMMTVGRAKGDSQDPHAPAAEGPGGNGDFVKHVQKLVNNVRRAEQKMRKQVAEQQQTDEKWAQFQKELKTAFMKERTKYKDRMDRLLKEKEEARAAQENAVEELYKMLADPQAYIQAPTDTEPAQDAQPGRLAPG